jgi:hypothetical protein
MTVRDSASLASERGSMKLSLARLFGAAMGQHRRQAPGDLRSA